ncbi:MAG: right-handed parallel beta-helix repeat-containing protein [Pseudomonadota bacterium]
MLSNLVLPILLSVSCGGCTDSSELNAVQPASQVVPSKLEVRIPDQAFRNPEAPISLEFTEDVEWRGGFVQLRKFDGTEYQTIETFDSSDFGAADSRLTISGNTLNIDPSDELESLVSYAVRIAPGAVEGLSGQPFAGLNTDSATLIRSGARFERPKISRGDYKHVVENQTFNSDFDAKSDTLYVNSTFKRNVDVSDVSNVAFVNSTFTNRRGYGISIADASNIKIAGSTFRKIRDTAILLRRSGSTRNVSIFNNDIAEIGGDGIHAAKRFKRNVDHINLVIYDNKVRDVGLKKKDLYHGIYTQSSEVKIINNHVSGFVDGNGISIRSDGVVWGNYINIVSGRDKGSGIKYFSDHKTGKSKTLTIADNTVIGSRLYSAIQFDMAEQVIPNNIAPQDFVVNHFRVLRNNVDARFGYVVEATLKDAPWSRFELVGDSKWPDPHWKIIR